MTFRSADAPAHAAAGNNGDVRGGLDGDAQRARVGDQRFADGVGAPGFHRRRQPHDLFVVAGLEGNDVGDVRPSAGQRSRLVEHDLAHAADLLEVRRRP